MKKIYIKVLFLLLLIPACSSIKIDNINTENRFVVWAFSDIQPRTLKEKGSFEIAVKDIIDSKINPDCAIAAGDISQYADVIRVRDTWEWFYLTLKPLNLKNIYEISGNHDARNLSEYLNYTKKPLNYSVTYGNLMMIFLSDSNPTSGTDVSDDVFEWWKSLVIGNKDKIIITVTHSQLGGTGFVYNIISYRNVERSERFTKVLKKEKIDIWLFGHTHVPTSLGNKTKVISKLNNAAFINVSAIREDYKISNSESRILYFFPGSDIAVIKTRNHRKGKFVDSAEVKIRLSNKFVFNNNEPIVTICDKK